jgi:hypothetical protein
LYEPIAKELRLFRQEQKNIELEKELKEAFNFFRKTTTCT